MLQVLEEIMELFNEDLDSVTWEEIRLEHFLSVLDTQKEGLKSCVSDTWGTKHVEYEQ